MTFVEDQPGGVAIRVKAVPGASRSRIVGPLGDALKVQVAAPPEKGKANQAIAKLLAKALGVALRDVTMKSGATMPRKVFYVVGLSAAAVRRQLGE